MNAEAAYFRNIQGDQKVSVHLRITVQSSGAQRHFDHLVQRNYVCCWGTTWETWE